MKINVTTLYYNDEDYKCPNCGADDDIGDPDNEYGCKCGSCGTCYETPDV